MSVIDIGAVLPTAMEELNEPGTPGTAAAARAVEEHGMPPEEAEAAPLLARTPEELAEVYTAYAEAGADRVVADADTMGWAERLDFIARARTLFPG
ncbi:hypothetical protein [Nocardiopsis coralli]|uniref:hypothetical protein n=1 Tax=Nocardiopsis coralli TaxID=2772213 RepID=UPI001F1B275A|nr:hypothetical protein [Nocardiopsis coralli]